MKRIGSAKLWHRKTAGFIICLLLFALCGSCGCAAKETAGDAPSTANGAESSAVESATPAASAEEIEQQSEAQAGSDNTPILTTEDTQVKTELTIKIDGQTLSVLWEDNESVAALRELAAEAPITIRMAMYGGFEQVGSIGTSLPRNDVQTTTEAGDIVLYSGNQIVIFYGSNSWAYTRLGRVANRNAEGMAALLANGDVTITISLEEGR